MATDRRDHFVLRSAMTGGVLSLFDTEKNEHRGQYAVSPDGEHFAVLAALRGQRKGIRDRGVPGQHRETRVLRAVPLRFVLRLRFRRTAPSSSRGPVAPSKLST